MTLRIAGIGICGVIVYVLVKQYKPEYAVIAELASGALLLFIIFSELEKVISFFSGIAQASGTSSEYIKVLIKVLGIALVTHFAAETCRDSGENALSSKIEFAGKILILSASLPLLTALTRLIGGLMENV